MGCVVWLLAATLVFGASASTSPIDAVKGLVQRLAPSHTDQFTYTLLNPSECKSSVGMCFGYRPSQSKVALEGTSGVELAMAFNHYLKYVTNSSTSWPRTGGNQINLPTVLPVPPTVRIERAHKYHYYANVCTFSYSFVWYTYEDWVREIDWMAMNGINLPLAYTGQERVYQKVYNSFGVSDEQLGEFFGGPAFLTWARGQGLMGWGGPLPQSWIDGQWDLQRRILPLMRAFGMKPVLPAFQGNVPLALMDLYPKANISRVGRCPNKVRATYACAPWIDDLDPLFTKLSDAYMKQLIADFGTDHFYAADGTFSHASAPWYTSPVPPSPALEGAPPSPPKIDMQAKLHSQAAYNGMARTDPEATWIYQTWSWLYGQKDDYMRGWVEGAPTGKLILLDLMAEESPLWKRTESYYGRPFIWCMLHNFGGNDGMWGDALSISTGPVDAQNAEGSTMVGTGLTMEGIFQNAPVYELMNEMAYRDAHVPDLKEWFFRYGVRRYGHATREVEQVWDILYSTVYNATGYGMMVSKDTITAIPNGTGWDQTAGSHWYNEEYFVGAWFGMLQAAKDFGGVPTFEHDVVDITRQALAKYSSDLYKLLADGVATKNTTAVKLYGAKIAELANDMDRLLCTVPAFLFGSWLEEARRWGGTNETTQAQMVWNAKTQVTFWEYPQSDNSSGPPDLIPGLMDYANKQWCGLLRTYYGARWQFYTDQVVQSIESGTDFDVKGWHTKLISWYDTWRTAPHSFPTKPVGNAVAVSAELLKKYFETPHRE